MKETMRFVSIDDLFIKKKKIKSEYQSLTFEEKEIYKWYFFYQLSLVRWRTKDKVSIKDAFWDYLNDNAEFDKINSIYIEFCNYKERNI